MSKWSATTWRRARKSTLRCAATTHSSRLAGRRGGAEAAKLKPQVEEKDKEKRIDLRHLPFVTIDGEDAATSMMPCTAKNASGWKLFSGGWKLYVSPLLTCPGRQGWFGAGRRGDGTWQLSVLPERVVPMLPEELSNGLCSLNPQVDRLAMVCEMTMSKTGKMTDYQFYEAVIHSHARLTYNKVSAMLEQPKSTEGKALRGEYSEVLPHLKQLYSLYQVLLAARA